MAGRIEDYLIEGISGRKYLFKCYQMNHPWNPFTKLPNGPGIYLFSDLSSLRSNNANDVDPKVLYVGQTKSFEERVTDSHTKMKKALNLGATDVCILIESSTEKRVEIEKDIYDKHKPPCNDVSPPNPFS